MSFDAAKSSLLESLASGIDFSPKGSIDAPIVHLVDFINGLPDFVTTSSCSGRISLYRDENSTKGIKWLKVVHGTVTAQQLKDAVTDQESTAAGNHIVALKCEGFILHIRCRDLDSGRRLHQVAMSCGFRESGLSVGQKMRVQLSIRTTAFGLELPIAVGRNLILDDNALDIIVSEANRRLRCNFARTDRLLNSMKREYSWPSMTCRSLPHSNIQRWGHSCSNGSGDSFMIIGGYGTDSSHLCGGVTSESPQSTRKLSNICYSEANADPKMFNLTKTEKSGNDTSMHAGSAMLDIGGVSLLLISGGRESPQEALSCLRVFKINSMNNESNITNFEITEYDISGDVPASRWGHTFTTLGPSAASNNFLLYGGRNEKQIFGDSYLLSAEYSETVLKFIWRQISSSSGDVMKSTSTPLPRFFHAACLVYVTDSIDIEKNQKHKELNGILNFDQSTRVLIHGGLLSLEDPTTCGCAYILDVRTGEWSAVPNIASSSTKKENINTFNGDADDAGHDFPVSTDDHIESTKRDNIDDTVSSVQKHGHAYVQNFFVQKFGHSITDIGGKTLVMSGGTAFENPGSADSDMKYEGLCALDLSMNDNAELCASVRSIVVSGVDGNECGDTRDIGGTKLDSESASAVTALPCGDCRCHHTAVYDKQSKSLLLHGGGALCLSFGAHYCTSISLQIKSGINSINSTIPCGLMGENPQIKNPSNSHFPGANNENSAMSKEATVVLLVLQNRVKLVKNFLENQKISWLDKERRITSSEISDDVITLLPITNFSLTQNDFQAFDDMTKMNKIKEKEMKSVKKEAVSLLISTSNDDKIFKKNVKSENQSLMAVPITSVLADLLNKGDRGLSSPLIKELCLCLGSDYFMDNSNVNCTNKKSEELNSGILELNIRIGRQAVRVKKSLLASGYRKADEYLESVVREYGLPSSASSFFPRKYEFVGNVLMIPEESLKGIWEGLLPAPLSGSDAQSLSRRSKKRYCSCFCGVKLF